MSTILERDAAVQARPPFGSRLIDKIVAFAAAPALFGFVFGWLRVGRAHDWPLAMSLAFWLTMALLLWLLLDLGSRIAERLLRRWHPALMTVLVAGALVGVLFMPYISRIVVIAFQDAFVPPALHRPLQGASPAYLVHSYLIGVILWVLTNLGLVHLLAVRRFGFGGPAPPAAALVRHAEPAAPAPAPPAFLSRIERPVGRLLAIMAEEHYLRVIGSEGDDLILYRISDAVRELAGGHTGLQVHRSYWIAREAVTGVVRGRSGPILLLSNGLHVPVGRTFRAAAAEAGLLDQRLTIVGGAAEPASGSSPRDDDIAAEQGALSLAGAASYLGERAFSRPPPPPSSSASNR